MQYCKVYVKEGPYGKGLYAKQPLKKGETILTVNVKEFVLYDTLMDKYKINTDGCSNKRSHMALLLAYEKYSGSEYCKTLPQRCINPTTMSEEQVRQFQNEQFVNKMLNKKQKLLNDYKILMRNNKTPIYLPTFMDAYSLIQSRTLYFCTPLDPTSEVGAMIPLYDMCNHSQQANSIDIYSHFYYDGNNYVMKAYKQYKQHEEIFISYGSYNDSHFVEYYGFIPHGNPNVIQLPIDRPQVKSKKAREVRYELMLMVCPQYVDHHSTDIRQRIQVNVSQIDVMEMDAIRILAIEQKILDRMDKKMLYSRLADPTIVDGDRVKQLIRSAAMKYLKQFPTSLEQDQAKMTGKVSPALLLALNYRIRCKKQILMLG